MSFWVYYLLVLFVKYFLGLFGILIYCYFSHCKEMLIYVFPEKELRGLSPDFPILVSVSDLLYIFSR